MAMEWMASSLCLVAKELQFNCRHSHTFFHSLRGKILPPAAVTSVESSISGYKEVRAWS